MLEVVSGHLSLLILFHYLAKTASLFSPLSANILNGRHNFFRKCIEYYNELHASIVTVKQTAKKIT